MARRTYAQATYQLMAALQFSSHCNPSGTFNTVLLGIFDIDTSSSDFLTYLNISRQGPMASLLDSPRYRIPVFMQGGISAESSVCHRHLKWNLPEKTQGLWWNIIGCDLVLHTNTYRHVFSNSGPCQMMWLVFGPHLLPVQNESYLVLQKLLTESLVTSIIPKNSWVWSACGLFSSKHSLILTDYSVHM